MTKKERAYSRYGGRSPSVTRIFDGEQYVFAGGRRKKKDAEKFKDKLRKRGFSVRVVPVGKGKSKGYWVYVWKVM